MTKTKNRAKIGVIGLGTAGITFISELKRLKAEVEITAFEKRGRSVFHPCSIPEAIEGKIHLENLIDAFPFHDVKVKGEAKKVLPDTKEVEFEDGKREKFDFIFIGTGGETPVEVTEKVLKATKYEDAELIRKKLEGGEVKKVVIVGAGILGLELASAIANSQVASHKPEVEVFELGDQVLPGFLRKELAELVEEKAKSYGVKFRFGAEVKNPEELDADLVIVCVGFKAVSLLPFPVKVNKRMQVIDGDGKTFEYIFASGDCIHEIVSEDREPHKTRKIRVPRVAPIAAEQARVSARNIKMMLEGSPPSEEYSEIVAPCILKAFDLEIGKTALITKPEKTKSFFVGVKVLPFQEEKLHTFFEVSEKGEILEVQGICTLRSEVRHLLDISYICMRKGIGIGEIRRFELSYQPEICRFPDPITSLAEVISRRLRLM